MPLPVTVAVRDDCPQGPAWPTRGLRPFTLPNVGLIGLALAVLTRSSELAIGIGIGYLLVVENLIGLIAPDATVYLPGGTLNALVSGGTSELAWGLALGLVVIYGIVAITVSLLVFHARDISS